MALPMGHPLAPKTISSTCLAVSRNDITRKAASPPPSCRTVCLRLLFLHRRSGVVIASGRSFGLAGVEQLAAGCIRRGVGPVCRASACAWRMDGRGGKRVSSKRDCRADDGTISGPSTVGCDRHVPLDSGSDRCAMDHSTCIEEMRMPNIASLPIRHLRTGGE